MINCRQLRQILEVGHAFQKTTSADRIAEPGVGKAAQGFAAGSEGAAGEGVVSWKIVEPARINGHRKVATVSPRSWSKRGKSPGTTGGSLDFGFPAVEILHVSIVIGKTGRVRLWSVAANFDPSSSELTLV